MDEVKEITKGYKYRIYPNEEQKKLLAKTLEEMCFAEGFSKTVVLDAIEHANGRWGAYTFVRNWTPGWTRIHTPD